jgi:signal transduction histidine kinase
MAPTDSRLFDAETWERALDQYGAVAQLTAALYDRHERLVCGPRPASPLFDFFQQHDYEPDILRDCVRQCLNPSGADPTVTVTRSFGFAVVGTALRLDNQIVGAAVVGYALIDFCQASAIESFAHHARLPFRQFWRTATQVQPVPEHRLRMHGQLLSILGDTILRAQDRTRLVEEMVAQLEMRVRDRTAQLATANESLAAEVEEHAGAEERARKLLSRLVVVREEERHRLARDVHDHMGQQMTALKLRLEVLQLLDARSANWAEQLEHTHDLVCRLDEDVDAFTRELRPLFVENLGVVRAMAHLVDEWGRTTGLAAQFHDHAGDLAWLEGDAHLNLFRITQEALNNVSKHAGASRVDVDLDLLDDRLLLRIADDGRGFDAVPTEGINAGMGLIGMQERAAQMGGTLAVDSMAPHGTVISVVVPLGARRLSS